MTAFLFLCFLQPPPPAGPAEDLSPQLLELKRVYIDKFGGGDGASHLREVLISALQRSGLFVVTENPDRADAILRGSAEDLIFTDTYQSSEGVSARLGGSGGTGTGRTREYGSINASIGEQESSRIAERKHEASAAVRLVNRAGDVIWSTTQESQGAKFRSAAADVADKIARRLQEDFSRARQRRSSPAANSK
jgi:hypothetical protein